MRAGTFLGLMLGLITGCSTTAPTLTPEARAFLGDTTGLYNGLAPGDAWARLAQQEAAPPAQHDSLGWLYELPGDSATTYSRAYFYTPGDSSRLQAILATAALPDPLAAQQLYETLAAHYEARLGPPQQNAQGDLQWQPHPGTKLLLRLQPDKLNVTVNAWWVP